jgi:hypothetical protein
MQLIQSIQNRIYEIRGERVMIDRDLAILYETESKVLNQAVKRNLKRFPADFMFQLIQNEWSDLRFQIETSNNTQMGNLRSQFVTAKNSRMNRFLPYAFTEQGVAMLSSVLNSDKAIQMNIAIMRAFVDVRKALLVQTDIRDQVKEIQSRLGEHDVQLSHIYEALENMLDEKAMERKWEERERIGFKK